MSHVADGSVLVQLQACRVLHSLASSTMPVLQTHCRSALDVSKELELSFRRAFFNLLSLTQLLRGLLSHHQVSVFELSA